MPKMQTNRERIFVAILAAGSSRRFGSPKQLATIHGETLVHRAARITTAVCKQRTLLIAGHEWRAVTRSAAEHCSFFALNEQAAKGIGSSIALAAGTLAARADAIVILLVDQIRISQEHLESLINSWSGNPSEIVATAFSESTGPPVLFPRNSFSHLLQLTGDSGAHHLLDEPQFQTVSVPFADAALDVDTVADLDALRR